MHSMKKLEVWSLHVAILHTYKCMFFVFDQLLCSDQIAVSRKLPFCLYLVWVYLDADPVATETHNTLTLK